MGVVNFEQHKRIKSGNFSREDMQQYSIEELLERHYGKDYDKVDPVDGTTIREFTNMVLNDDLIKAMLHKVNE